MRTPLTLTQPPPTPCNLSDQRASSHVLMLLLASLLANVLLCGCAPRVIVRANPKPNDRGIRYYRPKPYLKVEPAEVAIDKNQTKIVPGLVRISLAYLPDFSEEYSIDVRSGLGIASVGIKLEDGWNLTEISQQLDSQTDENTKAFASLLSAVGDVVPTTASGNVAPEVGFTVPARNVPIGFYESIIGRDNQGHKRLYGFRYVGFVPFAGCPIDMGGQQAACCNDPNSGLYGLSFVDGQMLFLPLDQMAHLPASGAPRTTDAGAIQATPSHAIGPYSTLPSPSELPDHTISDSSPAINSPAHPIALPLTSEQLVGLEVDLRAHLQSHFDGVGEVRAKVAGDRTQVRISLPAGLPALPIRQDAQQWLRSTYGKSQQMDVILEQ